MKLTLVKKKEEARDTYSFFFKSDVNFVWTPGQYVYLTLSKLNYPDERGDTRHFTISNSPTEAGLIRFTTRIRESSGYKKTLIELKEGETIEANGPNGIFKFDEKVAKKSISNVFLIGGIGITPVRSFLKYNIDKNLRVFMHLIYSNSDDEFVFKDELDLWSKENDYIKVDYINTTTEGRIDREKLLNITSSGYFMGSTFWIVGPTSFVSAMEDILEKLGVEEKNIRTEKFTGY